MSIVKISRNKVQSKAVREFDPIFERLRKILAPYAQSLAAHHDDPAYYYLETKDKLYKGRPVYFGAVRKGKAYVSYHLMPVYGDPGLRDSLSPALRKRMQGKSCFNFTAVDEKLFLELEQLTARCAAGFPERMLRPLPGATCD